MLHILIIVYRIAASCIETCMYVCMCRPCAPCEVYCSNVVFLSINNKYIITPCVEALSSDVHRSFFLVFTIGKRRLEKFSIATCVILNIIVYIQLARHWMLSHVPLTIINICE